MKCLCPGDVSLEHGTNLDQSQQDHYHIVLTEFDGTLREA